MSSQVAASRFCLLALAALTAAPITGCDDTGSTTLPDAAVVAADLSPNVDATLPYVDAGVDSGPALDDYLGAQLPALGVPGLSATIVKGTRVAWQGSYGFADVAKQVAVTGDTVFLLGYPSSVVTTVAMLQLWEKKLLDLDEDLNSLVFFQIHNPLFPMAPISSRMLLAGSSTILDRIDLIDSTRTVGDAAELTEDYLVGYLSPGGMNYATANFATFMPGQDSVDSITAMATAGYLVERVSLASDFAAYCQTNVLQPLGMADSSFRLTGVNAARLANLYATDAGSFVTLPQWGSPLYPSLTLRASANSLSHLLIALIGRGQYQGVTVLQGATVDEMLRVQLPATSPNRALGVTYLDLPSGRVVGSVGIIKGSTAMMYWQPDTGIGVIVLMNAQATDGHALLSILDRLFVAGKTL